MLEEQREGGVDLRLMFKRRTMSTLPIILSLSRVSAMASFVQRKVMITVGEEDKDRKLETASCGLSTQQSK